MHKPLIYTVHTRGGIRFHIEAMSNTEAEQRARHPAIERELARLLSHALADIDCITAHRGPSHLLDERLVFRDELFK